MDPDENCSHLYQLNSDSTLHNFPAPLLQGQMLRCVPRGWSASVWAKVCPGLNSFPAGGSWEGIHWPSWEAKLEPQPLINAGPEEVPGGLLNMLPWMDGDDSMGPSPKRRGLAGEPGRLPAHSPLDAV